MSSFEEKLARMAAETDRRIKDTDRRIKDTDRRVEETDRQIAEGIRRTDELDKQVKGVLKSIKSMGRQLGGQGNRLGRIIETLVISPKILKLLNQRDDLSSPVVAFSPNVEREYDGNKQCEFDGIAIGEGVVVVIEAKAKLTTEDIRIFYDKLSERFKDAYPEYRGHKVYGAVAAIRVDDQCKKFAIRRRLIVIEANPLEVKILNRRGFKFTDFGDHC